MSGRIFSWLYEISEGTPREANIFNGMDQNDNAYHPDIGPVTYSKFGRMKFSSFGTVPAITAASLDTLTMRTRDPELLEVAVDSRSGRRHLTR